MNAKTLIGVGLIIFAAIIFFLLNVSSQNPEIHEEPATDEINICDELKFPKLRTICYAILSENLSVCDEFGGKYKESCAKAILSKMEVNEIFCNKIKDNSIKNICLRKLAKSKGDLNLCQEDSCYFFYSTIESCNSIEINYNKYTCLAKVTKNLEYCDQIGDYYERTTCKALFSKNIGDCIDKQNILNPICAILVSKNSKWNYCLEEPTEYLRAKCVALASDKIENCNELEDEKDLCKIFFMGKDLDLFYE